MIEACLVDIRVLDLNVDEVPLARPPLQVAVILYRVGPGRLARNIMRRVAVGVGRQKRGDLLLNRRVEKALSDQRDDLVTRVAPREGRRWGASNDNRK
jgi:hypothetical protein